jgi:predicted metalloprotease
MRLDEEQESQNIEDRRGSRISRGVVGGGIGTVAIILVALFLGVDLSVLLQDNLPETNVSQSPLPQSQQLGQDEMRQFVARVLGSTERTWSEIFRAAGRSYDKPTLVLFSDSVQSACGFAQAAAGPFYCGADRKVYIDLSFYRDLRQRFQAPGDFAQAYVIAHEIGHHVQNLLGIMAKAQALQGRAGSQSEANALSVRLELQADCLAGIWASIANRERQILEPGDVEEGLNAAAQIGDDRIQKRAQGYVVPEGFTHGSAEQRVQWFRRGIETADLKRCDTFARRAVS